MRGSFKFFAGVVVGLGIFCFCRLSLASEINILVEKLVDKGVLTHGEARQILTETQEEIKKQLATGTSESVPAWIQNIKWGGDFRLRYEGQETEETSKKYRHRGRFRFRYGFTTKVNDQMDVGFRMASGEANPTSANQTFSGNFSSKYLWVDRAFLRYKPLEELTLIAGKIPNPFYNVSDLVWNGDINPEGGAVQLNLSAKPFKYFVNLGILPMYESGSNYDNPFLFAAQLGGETKISDVPVKAAVAYYDFQHLKGKSEATISPDYKPATNSLTGGVYDYDYKVFNVNAEMTPFTFDVFGKTAPLKVFGGYILNTAGNVDDDTGFLAGVSLGRARNPGDWSVGYTYYNIEKDAIAAIINSSDFETNNRGHKIGASYRLLKNTTFGLNYFTMESITGSKKDINKWQANLQVSF